MLLLFNIVLSAFPLDNRLVMRVPADEDNSKPEEKPKANPRSREAAGGAKTPRSPSKLRTPRRPNGSPGYFYRCVVLGGSENRWIFWVTIKPVLTIIYYLTCKIIPRLILKRVAANRSCSNALSLCLRVSFIAKPLYTFARHAVDETRNAGLL
ncbi:MAG: hypothetical protein GXP11_09835 [Gammaproteobacteria bacterium]|nr:hypothetical protein [Gammaproteobacteria bacterium]